MWVSIILIRISAFLIQQKHIILIQLWRLYREELTGEKLSSKYSFAVIKISIENYLIKKSKLVGIVKQINRKPRCFQSIKFRFIRIYFILGLKEAPHVTIRNLIEDQAGICFAKL